MASGRVPDTAIPLLLLAVSRVLAAGARLGAITDVVPDERYEADPGPDADVDPLRQGLANVFEGLDDYAFVVDPLLGVEVARGSLAGDLAELSVALTHGLQHLDAGRVTRPSGGGSSATSRRGATAPPASCGSCRPCSPTSASTPTTTSWPRPSSTRSTPDRPVRRRFLPAGAVDVPSLWPPGGGTRQDQ